MSYFIRFWAVTVFILSIIAISSALIAEYVFNLLPCKMCLYQRYPYYFIISIFILFYFFRKTSSVWFYILTELAIIFGLFYSIWHVGIEQKLLPGPYSCSESLNEVGTIEKLKEQIVNQAIINCNDISWSMLGLSAATINTILLIVFLLFNTAFIIKVSYGKEKNY